MRIAILVTCYNRVATTLAGLAALRAALDPIDGLSYSIFLVDDGSTDATGAAVRAAHPDIHVIEGTGSLYWNGGMCRSYDAAREHGSFDAYLLFNDDVITDPNGAAELFRDFQQANLNKPAIVVGSTLSWDGSMVTYSGYRRISRYRPRANRQVFPDGTLRDLDMPNANFALVPGAFFESVGGLYPGYLHDHGDSDLGLVAKKRGVDVFLARRPVGFCDANPIFNNAFKNANLPKRWTMLRDPIKGPNNYSHFVWRHMPKALYPAYMIVFYAKKIKLLFFP
jgi:GT2 family glycosyltransferase